MVVFVFFLWLILNGHINSELILFGLGISALAGAFLHMLVSYNLKTEITILKKLPLILLYLLNLILEIIKASINVMSVIISGKKPDSVLIEFHSGINNRLINTILANSITLTPGTYTVYQQDDRFVVHCLMESYADGIEESSFVKLLKKIIGAGL